MLLVSEAEWKHWQGDNSGLGPDLEKVQKPLEGKIQFVQDGEFIAPNLLVVFRPGHTPGLINLILQGSSQRIFFISDLLHSDTQLHQPDWSFLFDVDKVKARQQRDSHYAELTKPDTIIADGHFVNSAFGYITNEEDKLNWNVI